LRQALQDACADWLETHETSHDKPGQEMPRYEYELRTPAFIVRFAPGMHGLDRPRSIKNGFKVSLGLVDTMGVPDLLGVA
jgi:hypothetical protein